LAVAQKTPGFETQDFHAKEYIQIAHGEIWIISFATSASSKVLRGVEENLTDSPRHIASCAGNDLGWMT